MLPAHISLDQPPWQPHLHNAVMAMGLKRIEPSAWLQRTDIALDAYAQNKQQLTASLGDQVLQALPAAGDAVEELAQMIGKQLGLSALLASTPAQQPLDRLYDCSLQVAEDLCLLQRNQSDEGGYTLVAAHLCAPSHWRLEDKIGRAMDPIHAPVPNYQPALARSVNLFLDKLSPARLVERYNWSLDQQPLLCQRPSGTQKPADKRLAWYRVERQTLRRLPESGAIVFTILVRHWPLWFIAQHASGQSELEQAIEDMPAALRAYKNLRKGFELDWSKSRIADY